jgi:hypothetical protein
MRAINKAPFKQRRGKVMRNVILTIGILAILAVSASFLEAAYHHEGEADSGKFLTAYPDKAGTKLDHCALCHSGGQYESGGKWVTLGSCQWCHYSYGYDGAGEISETMNDYGKAYKAAGRNTEAIIAIDDEDSDGDGYSNKDEIQANRYPGDPDDDPSKAPAPYRIYTKAQLEAMNQHTQFLLMNTSRSGDFYAEYTGVPTKDLLDDAGILTGTATGILVYAPDGWSQSHPLDFDPDIEMYHVYGNSPGETYQYPPATFYYDLEADQAENPDYGWCDYSAPSCIGRSHGDAIFVEGGLKAILAHKREGVDLDPGVLNEENKLDGEGPFRVVVPQKYVNAPDQSSKSPNQEVIWPYNEDWDHNAGSCSRSATIIKVEPLPQGTTDINVLEAGWSYVDQEKIVVYGAIDGTDSNGNGILDSEENTDPTSDFDGDGTPDYMDSDTATFRHAKGIDCLLLHTSNGSFANVEAVSDEDPIIPQSGKPSIQFPYGAIKFQVVGLNPGESITVTFVFPENVARSANYYKVTSSNGWTPIPFGSNDGDNVITIAFTDGDALTDADGAQDGTIVEPGALGVPSAGGSVGDDGDGVCFIATAFKSPGIFTVVPALLLGFGLIAFAVFRAKSSKQPRCAGRSRKGHDARRGLHTHHCPGDDAEYAANGRGNTYERQA